MWLLEEVLLRPVVAFASALLVASMCAAGCSGSSSTATPGTTGDDSDASSGDDTDGGATDDGSSGDDGSTRMNDGSAPPNDAMPPPMSNGITIIVEPSDDGAALLNAIKGAQTSVHMTMYLLSSTSIINALIAQKNAGHDVKVVLNQTFPANGGSNASVYTQLSSAGVSVHWAPATFTYTHEKTVILDGKTAWIMTMNATQTSASANREYLAVDTDPADVAEAESIFEADFAGTAISPTGVLLVAPVNARAKLVALINTATTSVDMEAEELSDYMIVNALTAAADRGATVHIVLADDGTPAASQTMAVATLKQHGVKLVSLSNPYVHAKSCVVNGSSAYVGSENFTTGSLQYNRELGVIFSKASEVQKVLGTSHTDFSQGTAL